ncbi:MAG TPA: VWA domain-containing protein [Terracidiphilus sp.]|jgi:VWFA-related protein|nr:VWA domain-containing protein [Terracidiphilus sp.]
MPGNKSELNARTIGALLCVTALMTAIPVQMLIAQNQQNSPSQPTLQVTSTLVFLDVTVLDKKGDPVVIGLSKDDFTITEDKKPERIFSFEAPESHVMGANAGDDNPAGNAPVTIIVLDLLNSSFSDFAYIRDEVKKFLDTEPAQLTAPAELMVVGNESLEMLQGYTRNRADLLYALNHLPAALPYKEMNGAFAWERFAQSIDALQQIALQNKGVPGRKNIIWVGHGGPGIYLDSLAFSGKVRDELKEYAHETTNMLVDARISLFVIYPGLKVNGNVMSLSAMESDINLGDSDPFAGDINFGVFVNETGGELFYNRNDVDKLVGRSQRLGSQYYTLTYQPEGGADDGKFRRIRITLRDRSLRVVTKAGYFAPDKNAPGSPRQRTMMNLAEAARSTVPYTALDVSLSGIVRHPDTRSAGFTVQLKLDNLVWLPTDDGRSIANLILAAVSLSGDSDILASKMERVTVWSTTQDPTRRKESVTKLPITIRIPRKTKSVRVIMETEQGGRIGAADLERKTIDASPAASTPQLAAPHRPEYVPPTAP